LADHLLIILILEAGRLSDVAGSGDVREVDGAVRRTTLLADSGLKSTESFETSRKLVEARVLAVAGAWWHDE
jgi:hypothetical protein